MQVHDVERRNRRERRHQHRRNDREIFCDVVRDTKRGQRTARDQHLFSDFNDVDQLGRVAVEIDHIAGFASRLSAGVHGDADIGLSECGRVVRSIACHGDQAAFALFGADALEFVLRRRLRHKIVDTGFGGNCRGCKRIVASDHHRADAHFSQLREPFFDTAFDHIL